MAKKKKNPAPVSRFECRICRALPVEDTITIPWDGDGPDESWKPEAEQLEPAGTRLKRCPECGTYYVVEQSRDSDHWMANNTYKTLRRLGPPEARDLLKKGPAAERSRLKSGYNRQMSEMEAVVSAKRSSSKAGENQRSEAATALAWHGLREKKHKVVEKLLRHEDESVRLGATGALGALGRELRFSADVLSALVDLLGGDRTTHPAGHALHTQCFGETFAPALPALIDRLDHESRNARGFAAMLVDVNVRHAGPPPDSAELLKRIPDLVRHLKTPRKINSVMGGVPPTTLKAATGLLSALVGRPKAEGVLREELRRQKVPAKVAGKLLGDQ